MSGFPSRRAKPVNLVFHGIPPTKISEVCGVSISTARSYKNGNRRASKSVVTLMQLWRDGRILGPEFKGFRVHQETIVDPEGNITTASQLRGYGIFVQLLREWSRGDARRRAEVDDAFAIMEGRRA